MQENKLGSENLSQPLIPENAFILNPNDYEVWDGKLTSRKNSNNLTARNSGFLFIGVGIVFFIFGIILLISGNLSGLVAGLLIGGFTIFLGAWLLIHNQHLNELNRSGKVIIGEVTSIKNKKIYSSSLSTTNYVISHYKFVDPEGQTLTKSQSLQREPLAFYEMPEPGTPVVVIYHPKVSIMC
jgi:hypothetical protein